MAVVSVVARGIGCSGSAKQGIGSSGEEAVLAKSYRAHYRATCSDPSDTAPLVYAYLEANKGTQPWFGNKLTLGNGSDSSVVCDDISVDPVEGAPGLFDVVAHFRPAKAESDLEPQPGTADGASVSTNPLDWYDDIDVTFTQTSKVAEFGTFWGFFDTAGNPAAAQLAIGNVLAITNSAGVPYDPPIEDEKQIKVIRISRNIIGYDDTEFDFYQGTVNSDLVIIEKPFYNFRTAIQPLTGLIRLGTVFNILNGIRHYRQTTEIWVDAENWRHKLLDKGSESLIEAGAPNGSGSQFSSSDIPDVGNAPVKRLRDPDSFPITAPYAFNGAGQPANNKNGPHYYGIWQTKREVSWAPLQGKAW